MKKNKLNSVSFSESNCLAILGLLLTIGLYFIDLQREFCIEIPKIYYFFPIYSLIIFGTGILFCSLMMMSFGFILLTFINHDKKKKRIIAYYKSKKYLAISIILSLFSNLLFFNVKQLTLILLDF